MTNETQNAGHMLSTDRVRPRLLDLYCCAGGAAMGYHRAGFDVIGIDVKPQPNYPFQFVQADARDLPRFYLAAFDAIHASPPCQKYSPLSALSPDKEYPDLIAITRALLDASGVPYVIENVMSAPLIKERSIVLCGEMFGLRTIRHRRFESRLPLIAPPHPKHTRMTATSQRKARWAEGWHVSITGDVGTYVGPEAMGIDWMSGNELCEAIPPTVALRSLGNDDAVAREFRGPAGASSMSGRQFLINACEAAAGEMLGWAVPYLSQRFQSANEQREAKAAIIEAHRLLECASMLRATPSQMFTQGEG